MKMCDPILLSTQSSYSGKTSGKCLTTCFAVWTWPLKTLFPLFLHLKTFLASQNFTNCEELKSMVENWLNTQAADTTVGALL
jgi:hypothetical protein